jgi:hypothetical protein
MTNQSLTTDELRVLVRDCDINSSAYDRLKAVFNYCEARDKLQADEEDRRSKAIPVTVPNWATVRTGTLVKRSEHYIRELTYSSETEAKATKQLGIVTELCVFADDLCAVITFPCIHWEGESFTSMSHPMNARLASDEDLPTIVMNNNGQDSKAFWRARYLSKERGCGLVEMIATVDSALDLVACNCAVGKCETTCTHSGLERLLKWLKRLQKD